MSVQGLGEDPLRAAATGTKNLLAAIDRARTEVRKVKRRATYPFAEIDRLHGEIYRLQVAIKRNLESYIPTVGDAQTGNFQQIRDGYQNTFAKLVKPYVTAIAEARQTRPKAISFVDAGYIDAIDKTLAEARRYVEGAGVYRLLTSGKFFETHFLDEASAILARIAGAAVKLAQIVGQVLDVGFSLLRNWRLLAVGVAGYLVYSRSSRGPSEQ